jgi:membrane-associated protein
MFVEFNLVELIKTFGYLGLFFIVFAESGMFFGFFFPGDSLLFTAGILASQGFLNIWVLVPLLIIAAITGDSAGYWMGNKFGSWLLRKKDSLFFKKKYLDDARVYYDKHGGKTLILARFIPAIRTFAPIVAGMAKMEYSKFLSFNIVGGIIWGAGMTLFGYTLGNILPSAEKYFLLIIAAIIIISISPGIYHLLKSRMKK